MPRAFLSGLRGRILLLVILATLPAFGLSLYASWRDRQHQVTSVVENTVRLARVVANDQERIIEGTRQILSDLASIPEVRAGDPAHARMLFALLMKQWRGYASFTLADPAGRPLVSLPTPVQPIDFSQRSWFQAALTSGQFTVGEYQVGQVTGKQVVVTAWPIVQDGRVVSVIAAALDVEWLNQIASDSQLPAGSLLMLVDRHGALVARHPAAPELLGRPVAEDGVVQAMRTRAEGSVELSGPDGTRRIYVFTPVRGRLETGFRLVIGVPHETAYGAIDRHRTRQLLVLLLVAGLTLACAWIGADRIVLRRVASLLEAMRKLAAGDPAARTQLPYGQGELSDLARAFDEMATALQSREAERQRAETALRESEERFRAFMENTPAMAFVKDEAGRCIYANAAFERYFGLTRQDWFGRTDLEIFPASPNAETSRRDDLRVLATNEAHQSLDSLSLPDGRAGHWMTIRFPLSDASGRRLVGAVSVDMTEWRRAQAALARSERRYEQLVEQAWDAIVLSDAERQILAVNTAACTMTGYSREELLGMRLTALIVLTEGTTSPLPEEQLKTGGVVVSECTARRKDGSLLQIELAARQLENGRIQLIVRDITSRRAAEQALRESEERYRLLYEYLPLAYQSLAEDGTIVDVNEAWLALAHRTRQDAVGRRFDAFLDQGSQLRFLEGLARAVRVGEVHDLEAVFVRGDGAPVTVSIDLRRGCDERGDLHVHCVLDDVSDARAAAARLRESEERYRSLFADSPIALFEEDFSGIKRHLERLEALGVTDLTTHFAAHPEELADCIEAVRVVDVNKAALTLYAAETRFHLLSGLDQVIGHDGHPVFEAAILALARGERSWQSEGTNYTFDGEPIKVLLQWSVAPGAERDWSRVLVSAMETGGRARAEAALRESDTRFERAFRSSPILMAISTRAEGRLVDVNEALVRALGYSRREMIGRTTTELGLLVPPFGRAQLLQTLTEPGGTPSQEARFRRKDGRVMDGICSAVPLPVDGQDCLLVQVIDMTARKRAEEAERESQRMLAALTSNLPGMVYQCCNDPEWTMLFVSEGCRELTGYEPADLVGNRRLSYASLVIDEDRDNVQAEVRQAVVENRPFRFMYRIRRADGEIRWVWEQGRVGQTAAGEPITLEGFIADVTDRRAAEERLRASTEQLRQAQKMEAVGRLAGGVAHDFNNLLTAIVGFADLMLSHLAPGDPMTERVEEITRAGERAARLTRQLITLSRKQVLAPQVVALDGLIRQMTPALESMMGEEVELNTIEGGGACIEADPTQIEQALVNLAVNARDAMPRGGALTLETWCLELDEQEAREVGLSGPGRFVALSVSDTGAGMDEATRLRLFEPFFTTKPEGQGTGLGLSTVYGIVQQSGGAITVESAPGEGTTFRLFFPRVEGVPETGAYPAAPLPSVAGTETVLVVEDEDSIRRLMRSVLERHGYSVLAAADGQEALAVFERECDRIALVITDVVMPRMDGPALASEVLLRRPQLPVVYVSGYSEELARRTRVPGSAALLQKPFTSAEFMGVVRRALDRAPSP